MNGLQMREDKPPGPGRRGATAPDGAGQPSLEEQEALRCRRCGQNVTHHSALFCMDSDTVSRVFPNPHGLLREILTALHAEGVRVEGPPTTEFTWFAGYAWQVAYCSACSSHLGWLFTAVRSDLEPETFWGLLREALAEA